MQLAMQTQQGAMSTAGPSDRLARRFRLPLLASAPLLLRRRLTVRAWREESTSSAGPHPSPPALRWLGHRRPPHVPSPVQPADDGTWPSQRAREALTSDMTSERIDAIYADVRGRLPAWLQGSMYRNGPGKFRGAHALMDGMALLARFKVDGPTNQVVFSSRFLDSTSYRAVRDAAGEIRWKLSHPESSAAALHGLRYAGGLTLAAMRYGTTLGDNAVISIYPHGEHLVAHTETKPGTFLIDPETLETLGRVHYRDDIHGQVKLAHPHTLPNGDVITMAADFTPTVDRSRVGKHIEILRLPEITVCRQRADCPDVREKIAAVPFQRPTSPTWVHDLAVSEHYAVVVQNPVHYNIRAMVSGSSTQDGVVFNWRPRQGSLLHVVPLDGSGPVRTFTAPAFLATHWINAFEEGHLLHLDAAVAGDPGVMGHWTLDNIAAGPAGGKEVECSTLRRLTIDLSRPDGRLTQQPLLEQLVPDTATGYAFELPQINPAARGRRHRYAYGACCVRPSNCWNALCKLDVGAGTAQRWHEAGGAAWEPLFVAQPGATSEDDGVVLCTITQADGRAALLVLDAARWTEVARAVLPLGLPNGLHSCWVGAGGASGASGVGQRSLQRE